MRRDFNTNYHVFVVLGDPLAEPLWRRAPWLALAPSIEALLGSNRGTAASLVRLKEGNRTSRVDGIAWSEEEHRSWTVEAGARDRDLSFLSMELWAPAREECDAKSTAPDVFLGIRNEETLHPGEALAFNPYVLLAAPAERSASDRVRQVAVAIAAQTRALLRGYARRTWGLPFGSGGFTDVLGDAMITDVFKVGDPHRRPVSLDTLEGAWQTF